MHFVHLTIIVVFAAAVLVFAIQNLGTVTMSFLGFSVRAPLAFLTAIVYLLGAATGGALFALLRRSMQATRTIRSATS